MLQSTIAAMPTQEAEYHMKRCIDSGLWVPDAKSKDKDGKDKESEKGAGTSDEKEIDETAEPIYSAPDPE